MIKYSRMEYKNGKIYKILNTVDNSCYVGSTTQTLSTRMAKHRAHVDSEAAQDRKLYSKLRELGKDSFYIELIEDYPCDSKDQLRRREGLFIRELATLNHVVAGRTAKEWKSIPIACCCGVVHVQQHRARHCKSKKHMRYVEQHQDT